MKQEELRTILSTVFNVDSKYVVPKQGNWWNPQDSDEKAATWVAFIIRSPKPRTQSVIFNDPDVGPISAQYFTGTVELQIVGTDAEDVAYSVGHWLDRYDVVSLFDSYKAQLMADGIGSFIVSTFAQDGLNTVLAYNVSFGMEWADFAYSAGQSLLETVDIEGAITA